MNNSNIYLSVIIPTRNREKKLKILLESLRNQKYPQRCFEIIVVDNGSSDNTKAIADKYTFYFKNFKYIYEAKPGLHVGRHIGLKVARGDILVYADDDIYALDTWLEGIVESFEDPKVALVGGNNYPRYESRPPKWEKNLWIKTRWGKALPQYSILDFGKTVKSISPQYVWGCNFSIRKSILLEIGGFHPDGMPKELLFYRGDGETFVSQQILKKRYKTIFNPKASVYHWVSNDRMTIDYIYRRGYMQGISDSYTEIRCNRGISVKMQLKVVIEIIVQIVNINFNNITKAHKKNLLGYYKGYINHQNKVRKNKDLLKWILKKNYLL
jgi:glycosyltransferase involved in cell wall biosynthesis